MSKFFRSLATAWVIGLPIFAATDLPAFAADWRYCLARDEISRRVYFSSNFYSEADFDVLQAAFDAWLDQVGLAHSTGTCPRADTSGEILAGIKQAADFNTSVGYAVTMLQWPASQHALTQRSP